MFGIKRGRRVRKRRRRMRNIIIGKFSRFGIQKKTNIKI